VTKELTGTLSRWLFAAPVKNLAARIGEVHLAAVEK